MKAFSLLRGLLLGSMLTVAASPAMASSLTWGGGVSGTWQNAGAGWTGASSTWSNSNPDAAVFGGATPMTAYVDPAGITVGNISFNATGYTIAGTGVLTLANSSISVGNSMSGTISAPIAGTTGLIKSGSGTLVLGGSNSYSGNTTVSNGTLQINNANALGTGSVTLNGAQVGAVLVVGADVSGNTVNLDSSTTRSRMKTAGGGTRTWNGSIVLVGGSSGAGAPEFTNDSGAPGWKVLGTISGSNGGLGLTIRGAGSNGTLGAVVNIGTMPLTKTDALTWTITSNGNTWGNTSIQAGVLKSGTTNSLPQSTNVVFATTNTPTLDLGGYDLVVGSLSGGASSSGTVSLGSNTLTIAGSGTTTFVGSITGAAGKVVKSGAGTTVLTGTNSFGGGMTVQMGLVQVSNASQLGSGTVTLSATNTGNRPTLVLTGSIGGRSLAMDSNVNRPELRADSVGGGTWNGEIVLSGSAVNGPATLTNNSGNGALIVSGSISGSVASSGDGLLLRGDSLNNTLNAIVNIGSTNLSKSDTGKWKITSSENTWGSTTIAMGTLQLGSSNAIPASSNLIMGTSGTGAKLDLNGLYSLSGGRTGTLAISSTPIIDFGATGTAQTLEFGACNLLNWGSATLTINGFEEGIDRIRFGTSPLGLTAAQISLITVTGISSPLILDDNGYLVIPEPSAPMLIAAVAVGAVILRRRPRRA